MSIVKIIIPNIDEIAIYNKSYQDKNRNIISKQRKDFYVSNKEIISERRKSDVGAKRRQAVYQKTYRKNRLDNDPSFKLRVNISKNIYNNLLKNNSSKNGNSVLQFLPYTILELKEHLERQFESWMTWENCGRYDSQNWNDNDTATWTWQLDHIIPQSDLPYTSMTDDNFKKCWDLNNLRPLSSKKNFLDGVNRTRHEIC